ncbi:MAG: hypothetical protein WB805_15870 [Candidatus Dormiibacterota bacterium]
MRRYLAGLCTAVLTGAAASVAAAPVDASRAIPAATPTACTPGTWVQQPANVLPSQGGGLLYAAAVATPTLAWAVGFYENNSGVYGSLIEKWTGGTSWTVVGSGGKNVQLRDVAAFGAKSAFAVGTITINSLEEPMVTQWNGTSWTRTIFSVPAGDRAGGMIAISGSSARDVWAVGTYLLNGVHLLVEHWNGSTWTHVTMPSTAKLNAQAEGVVAVGPGDLWMDGFSATNVSRFWHYNGTWTLESTPPSDQRLAGSSDSNIWMIGGYSSSGTPLAHFNGTGWASVDNNGDGNVGFNGIAMGASPATLWTVGFKGVTSGPETTYIARNGVDVSAPALTGSLDGIGTGSGLAFAVGNSTDTGTGVPIVLASCD